MQICDFEVLRDGDVVAARRSLALPDIRAAWSEIAELARRYDAPGCKIRVKDEAGRIVILTGVAAVALAVTPLPGPSTEKAAPTPTHEAPTPKG